MIQFPRNFLWGAASSAYQVEGNNANSDWWHWEKAVGLEETSGDACRHYELFKQDFDLAKSLHHNAHRLSVEWSRIEPEEGKFSQKEINHYIEVIAYLRQLGIEPLVTLHHFTNPLWFAKLGGWENRKAAEYFLRFSVKVAEALSDRVNFWLTINEPMVYVYHAYILGAWPPQEKSLAKSRRVTRNLINAHIKVYRAIHDIYKQKGLFKPSVSIAKNMQFFMPSRNNFINRLAVSVRDKSFNMDFLNKLSAAKTLDFIGVNYYTRSLVDVRGLSLKHFLLDIGTDTKNALKKNSLGWDIYPDGLYQLLLKLKKYNLPVIITENGVCTGDDKARWDFIAEHLKSVYRAIQEGVKITGYLYWSLTDNFEWDKGFSPRFGLMNIDYKTYARGIRDSAKKFSDVCKTGILG